MEPHIEGRLAGIQRLGETLSLVSERWMPDSMIIVWILTFVSLALAFMWGMKPAWDVAGAWGQGFWEFLPTSMQICIMLMTGHVVARSPVLRRAWSRLAALPSENSPAQAVALLSLFSMLTAWVHWGLSLMASSMLAVLLARRFANKVDYRLLIASAYLGLGCTWHAGLTGTAPLWANTPNNPLMKNNILSILIPQTQTIFTAFNLILVVIVIVAVTALMYALHPPASKARHAAPEQLGTHDLFAMPERTNDTSPSSRMLWWPGFNFAVVALGIAWIVYQARSVTNASQLFTFDNTNFIFLLLGIALNYRPVYFLKAVEESGRAVWGIIIQFPFYGGIFGLFKFTKLGETLAGWFVTIGTPQTFPLITYWYTGVLNYFVPSGGSEWLITSPYLVQAAERIHVPYWQLILSYAWGNMMTDMIQPFFAIPLMTIAKLQFREVLGYLLLVFLLYFVITTAAFCILPRL